MTNPKELKPLRNLVITKSDLSPTMIDTLKQRFERVGVYPDGKVPEEEVREADVWFSEPFGFPSDVVGTLSDIPRLKLLQISSGQLMILPFQYDI